MARESEVDDDRRGHKKLPYVLFIGELMLAFVLLRYLMNFTSMVSPIEGDWIQVWANLQSIVVSLLMSVMAVSAIIGIPSARPPSWRKVVRSSIILFLFNLLYDYLDRMNILNPGIVFNVWVIGLMMVAVVILMFLPSVRRFYTPPLMDPPPLKAWVLYLLNVPMDIAESYKFEYQNDPKESGSEER